MFILDDILLSPLKGLVWLAEKVDEVAQKELYDKDTLKAKLMELQLRFELDEITEAEYTRQEAELLERLNIDMEEDESADESVDESASVDEGEEKKRKDN
ncbi:MAG: gas vesicle protein GvpG [Lentisphaerota bacterium]